MFSSFFKYFANATYFYMKTEMVYSIFFHFSRRSYPEKLTVTSAYIFVLVRHVNRTHIPNIETFQRLQPPFSWTVLSATAW